MSYIDSCFAMMFAQHAKCSLQSIDSRAVAINPINALVTSIDRFELNRSGDCECLPLFIVFHLVCPEITG